MPQELIIKNMVCPRCVTSVKEVFQQLNLSIGAIQLGKVSLNVKLKKNQKEQLEKRLLEQGFELLDGRQTKIINEIKSILIEAIHHQDEYTPVNFSTLLAEKIHFDYAYMSRLFSTVEGQTIERFVLAQKIEKVKELLMYDELNLSEIAYKMHYSSSAHLSAQFKKMTGMTPSAFKKLSHPKRKSLDEI